VSPYGVMLIALLVIAGIEAILHWYLIAVLSLVAASVLAKVVIHERSSDHEPRP
jgi:hypothetical protein